jgi:hypothetical protein
LARARIDADGETNPHELVGRVYTDEFIAGLAKQFDFDAQNPDIVRKIKRIGQLNIVFRRDEPGAELSELRGKHLKLAGQAQQFLKAIKSFCMSADKEILYMTAVRLEEPPPQTEFPGLTEHEKRQTSEPYLRELERLTRLFQAACEEIAEFYTLRRGPKINSGLQVLVMHAVRFFKEELNGRPFTLDHYKPFKSTQAYDFVKVLVEPLDDATHDNIVTAIRVELRRRTA